MSWSKSASPQPFSSVLKPASGHKVAGKGHASKAQEEARRAVFQDAYDEGYAEGVETGRNDGWRAAQAEAAQTVGAQVDAFSLALQDFTRRLPDALTTWCAEAEVALAPLAVFVATRIVGREIQADPDVILTMVREALQEVVQTEGVRIRMNPLDVAAVEPFAAQLQSGSGSLRQVDFVRDPHIVGGCLIETSGGTIDARVDSMIHQALASLRGETE